MGPFSKYLGIFQYIDHVFFLLPFHHSPSNNIRSFLFLRDRRNPSIVDYVILDDLVNRRPGNAHSLGDVGDRKPDGPQVPIFAESQLYSLDFHRELDLGPVLQELVYISDRQVDNVRILLTQNLVVAILLHLLVEVFSLLLDGLDHVDFWDDVL